LIDSKDPSDCDTEYKNKAGWYGKQQLALGPNNESDGNEFEDFDGSQEYGYCAHAVPPFPWGYKTFSRFELCPTKEEEYDFTWQIESSLVDEFHDNWYKRCQSLADTLQYIYCVSRKHCFHHAQREVEYSPLVSAAVFVWVGNKVGQEVRH